MIYRLLLRTLIFNEYKDRFYDKLLLKCLESGIDKILECGKHHAEVVFYNGIKFRFWNTNKYYAWLTEGCFTTVDTHLIHFKDSRPSAKAMYLLQKQLIEKV